MYEKNAKTILLVEDEPITSLFESRILEKHGYNVIIETTGEKAVKTALGKQNIDIILMDIDLGPGMDGTEAAEVILKEKHIPILFLSNHTEPEIVDKTEKITSYGYVVKNTGETVLLASIRMAFRLNEANLTIQNKSEELEAINDELMKSESAFRTLFEASPTGIGLVVNRKFQKVNTQLCEMTGYSAEELIGTTTRIHYADDDEFRRVGTVLYDMIEREGLGTIETRLMHKDGRIINVFISGCPLDHRNISSGIVMTLIDITKRKRAEELLLESEERYRTLFENATEGLFMTTPAGRYINVNPSVVRMFRYSSPRDMIDTVTDIGEQIYAHPEDRLKLHRIMQKHGKAEGLEIEMVRKDKTRIWINMNIHTVNDKEGNILYYDGACADITERKRAEELLRKSEERYRTLFENATEGLFLTTPSGRYINVNPSVARMFRYSSPQDMIDSVTDIGKQIYAHPEDRQNLHRIMQEHGKAEGLEIEMVRKDKTRIWISMNIHAVYDKNGNILHYDGTCIDITERKKAEETLKDSEARYRTLINKMHDAVYRADLEGNLIFTNPSAARILGIHSVESMTGLNISKNFYYNPEDRGMLIEALQKHREITHYEVILKRWDTGDPVIVSTNSWLFRDRNGTITGIEGVFSDITEQKQAETALKESEEKFATAFNASPEIITLSTLDDGTYLEVNEAFVYKTGYSREEAIGKTANELGIWVDHQDRINYTEELATKGRARNLEIGFRIRSGEIRDSIISGELIEFRGRQCIMSYITDITESKNMAIALEKTLNEKQVLLRELQHRIKNNLAMIAELIELEKGNSTIPETLTVLDNLKWRTHSLASLYDLLFQSESVTEVELDEYLHSIASSLASTYIGGRRNVQIEEHYDDLKVSIKDAAAWGLIFNELVTNALKYAFTKSRQGIIGVSLKKTKNRTELTVSDNGPGPPKNFNIERSAGFGLMLVKILTDQLEGTLSFKRGNMNSFVVKIPAKRNDL